MLIVNAVMFMFVHGADWEYKSEEHTVRAREREGESWEREKEAY